MEDINLKNTRTDIGKKAGLVGILCNFSLAAAKIMVGVISSSLSIMADGLNNLSDAAASIVTLLGFRLSERPADTRHPYGHARYEYIAGLIISIIILVIGMDLAKSSIGKIISPEPSEFYVPAALVLTASIILKICMYFYYSKMGKIISSKTLFAAAADSRNDCLTTAAVLAASIVEEYSGIYIDGIIGAAVAFFIIRGGITLAMETLSPLLGEGAAPELRGGIVEYIMKNPHIIDCHDLMIHDYGPGKRYATIHVEMDQRKDPMLCHDTIDTLEKGCLKDLGINLVIHYDPVFMDDKETNRLHNMISRLAKLRDGRLSIHDFRLRDGAGGTIEVSFDIEMPDDLRGKEDDIKRALEDTVEAIEGRPCLMSITFDRAGQGAAGGIPY